MKQVLILHAIVITGKYFLLLKTMMVSKIDLIFLFIFPFLSFWFFYGQKIIFSTQFQGF